MVTVLRLQYTFNVNVIAAFDFVRHAMPYMPNGSAIINTVSIQAYDPSWFIVDYASTKGTSYITLFTFILPIIGALVVFTKGLAQHAISKGIRVNAVAPGM